MKKKYKIRTISSFGLALLLTCCGLSQPAFATEIELINSLSFSSFIQTVSAALFATCVAGVWRMSSQLTAMNARLTNAVSYIDQRLNDQHQRLLYQERTKA